jgi:hypothetical protein
MYPWPIDDFDYVMDQALDIAMDYLERTEQAVKFIEVQRVAATAIVTAWKMGVRHRLRLANIAIKAVERKAEPFLEDQERG